MILEPRITAHRKAKRKRGLCAETGCPLRTGNNGVDYRCPDHKVAHAEEEKERRAAKRGSKQ